MVEILWQLISLNREYLGKGGKKGTFLCRYTKVGDFDIGKNAIEQTNSFLKIKRCQLGQLEPMTPIVSQGTL